MSTLAASEAPPATSRSKTLRVALIGYGAIGRSVAEGLTGAQGAHIELSSILVRTTRANNRESCLTTSIDRLIDSRPDLVIECAGHEALRRHGPSILRSGANLMVVSSGALVDAALEKDLISAARNSGANIEIPAGAIGGVDAISAARRAGLSNVRHISIKPARAWRGTHAERETQLDLLREPIVIFEGTARDAATKYPENANVSATISLAGLGLDRTRVQLIADPDAAANTHIIEADGAFGTLSQTTTSPALDGNPKSSSFTAYSVVNAVLRKQETIRI